MLFDIPKVVNINFMCILSIHYFQNTITVIVTDLWTSYYSQKPNQNEQTIWYINCWLLKDNNKCSGYDGIEFNIELEFL